MNKSSKNENKKYYFYKAIKRKILPEEDIEKNSLAKKKLQAIKKSFFDELPEAFKKNWNKVSLYHPKSEIDKANSLILNPDEGSYSLRNKLNHLTGKEWTKFTKSWFIFDALSSDLTEERRVTKSFGLNPDEHPATYSPTMMEEFINFFTKEGEIVLDPFAGIGSTLVACDRTKRNGIGVEINKKYFDIIKLRSSSKIINGDSRKIKSLLKKRKISKVDFSISSPPYWNILSRSTGTFKAKREEKELDIKYSDSMIDIGNIDDYDEFIDVLSSIYFDIYEFIKTGGYLVVIVKNLKKSGKHYPLAWDLAQKLSTKYTLKDEKIWCQDKVGLSPFGYPFSWTSNIVHHYCLIFKKE